MPNRYFKRTRSQKAAAPRARAPGPQQWSERRPVVLSLQEYDTSSVYPPAMLTRPVGLCPGQFFAEHNGVYCGGSPVLVGADSAGLGLGSVPVFERWFAITLGTLTPWRKTEGRGAQPAETDASDWYTWRCSYISEFSERDNGLASVEIAGSPLLEAVRRPRRFRFHFRSYSGADQYLQQRQGIWRQSLPWLDASRKLANADEFQRCLTRSTANPRMRTI